jgi:acetolactate synthase I/II/III large subunit
MLTAKDRRFEQMTDTALRTGGRILVDALLTHGVDRAFCVPGESYLALLDALYDVPERIALVACRQEGGAAFMAEAYGKLTGRPGICIVTRGPGATNASIGVHTAFQDSTPMILFIGQVARDQVEREAFQEMDFRRMFGQMAKWVAQIDDAARIPEYVRRAFHVAVSGRPGPVVLALPEDMLAESAAAIDTAPYKRARQHPGEAEMARLREMLEGARQPLMMVGGAGWNAAASAHIQAFAAANQLPTGCVFRRQDCFDNFDPRYAGDIGVAINPRLAQRVRDADVILVVGPRLGEMTTSGYTLLEPPVPRQRLIHVHPDPEELNRVYQAELAICADMESFAAAARGMAPVDATAWKTWTAAAHADYLQHGEAPTIPGALQMGAVMETIGRLLPAEAILTNGAGNYTTWAHRFYRFRRFGTQLGPTSGAMGYGLPAAVAAKLVHPERPVVAFAGDGCFLMNGQELATAVQYGAAIVVLVVNNGMYGTIRMHQERRFPGRTIGTDLVNPDFAALARAYGAHGETVRRTEEFEPAFARALAADRPTVIELVIDPQAITPNTTLDALRGHAQ